MVQRAQLVFLNSIFSVRYFVWYYPAFGSLRESDDFTNVTLACPFSVYCEFFETFYLAAIGSSDIFDTVNLSFWGWSIGSASRSCARYGTLYCRQDPHRRSEIKGKPGKLDLNPRVKGAVAEVSRSCNTSKKSGLSRSNRSVVLLQSNFKSLKIASAVAPCLCLVLWR